MYIAHLFCWFFFTLVWWLFCSVFWGQSYLTIFNFIE